MTDHGCGEQLHCGFQHLNQRSRNSGPIGEAPCSWHTMPKVVTCDVDSIDLRSQSAASFDASLA